MGFGIWEGTAQRRWTQFFRHTLANRLYAAIREGWCLGLDFLEAAAVAQILVKMIFEGVSFR